MAGILTSDFKLRIYNLVHSRAGAAGRVLRVSGTSGPESPEQTINVRPLDRAGKTEFACFAFGSSSSPGWERCDPIYMMILVIYNL